MRPEVGHDVRRPGARRIDTPTRGGEEHVVAQIAAVDERDARRGLPRRRRRASARRAGSRGRGSRSRARRRAPLPRRRCARLSSGRDRERLLADDVDPALDRRERLRCMKRVRRADVQHVDALALEELLQVVVRRGRSRTPRAPARVRPADRGDLDADRPQRNRVHARDEPGADDRRPHQRDGEEHLRQHVDVEPAPSGGVLHGIPSTMQSWKCRKLARERLVVRLHELMTSAARPSRRSAGRSSDAASATGTGTRGREPRRRT